MSERVSVIICTRNYAHFLGQCLESVAKQTCPPDEVIVVDDGSTDNTPAIVSEFKGVRYLRQEHAGKAAAFNHGFAASTGDIVCHLDADDYWLPEKLSSVLQAFSTIPAGGLTHDAYYVDGKGNALYGTAPMPNGVKAPRYLPFRNVLLMCLIPRPINVTRGSLGVVNTLCVRRKTVADIFPLPTELGLAVDGAMLLGAARNGILYLPQIHSAYRHHGSNHFVSDPSALQYQRRLFRWVLGLNEVSETYDKKLLETLVLQEDVQAAMSVNQQPLKTAYGAGTLVPRLVHLGLVPHWKQFALPLAALLGWRKVRPILLRLPKRLRRG